MSRIRQDTTMGLWLLLLACFALMAESFTVPSVSQHQRQTPAFVTKACSVPTFAARSQICLQSSSSTSSETSQAEAIFQKHCDKDGFMTKASLEQLKFITELLKDGDLEKDELEEIWNGASKSGDEQINEDSFVKIFKVIDELFEEEEEEPDVDAEAAATAEIEAANAVVEETPEDNKNRPEDAELLPIFKSIADGQGLLTQEALSEWEEVQSLKDEGLLGEDEFDTIWGKMPKTDGQLDLVGFLKFNGALDDLFDFEDEEEAKAAAPETAAPKAADPQSKGMVNEEGLSPAALFVALRDDDGLVGMPELKRWGELQDMIAEGELKVLELENFFDEIVKSDKQSNKLAKNGFLALYDKIDALFEEDNEEEDASEPQPTQPTSSETKDQLLTTVASLNSDEERLPCGLECTDSEQKYVEELVATLEAEGTNQVRLKKGAIEMADLAGSWELLYSSSAAMAYNKGLSGLGGSFPNGKFAGLKMKLVASNYMCDMEYTERIKVVPDSASFDVTVNGSWDVRSSVSIFTGEPSVVLALLPNMVRYGPTETRADHWKSLGPTNMLDLSYLDEDLRIMKGNTSTDSILVFKRIK